MSLLRNLSVDDRPCVLVATDLSETSRGAIRVGAHLAQAGNAHLKVIHVVDMLEDEYSFHVLFDSAEELEARVDKTGHAALRHFVEEILGSDVEVELVTKFGHPVDDIVRAAHFDDAVEIVVCGTTGQSGLRRFVFGTTAGRLIRECDKPVLVVPPDVDDRPVKKILAPVDLSETSKKSLSTAMALAAAYEGEVLVYSSLYVPPISPFYPASPPPPVAVLDNLQGKRMTQLKEFVDELNMEGNIEILPIENAETTFRAILERAKEFEVDLICMGTHGRKGIERAILGSTAERVLRETTLPVLVVR